MSLTEPLGISWQGFARVAADNGIGHWGDKRDDVGLRIHVHMRLLFGYHGAPTL